MPNHRIIFEIIATCLIWAPFTACYANIFSLSAREHVYSYSKQNPSRRIIDKSAASQLVNKFLAFNTILRFFPRSQQPATCPYPELELVHAPIPLPGDPSQYYPSIYTWVIQAVSFCHGTRWHSG
jgi:hypothetical protein